MEIILQLGKLLTKSETSNKQLIFDGNHLPTTEKLVSIVESKFGTDTSNVQLIFVLNVANVNGYVKFPEGTVKGSHFSLAVYSLDDDILTYVDTLGWGAPLCFANQVKALASAIGRPLLIKCCHRPTTPGTVHICDPS